MPHTIVAFFTGNQSCKTATVSYSYVLRLFGWHPVPQKNVLFFECENLQKEYEAHNAALKAGGEYQYSHPWVRYKLHDGTPVKVCRQGTYVDSVFFLPRFEPPSVVRRPKDNICPVCGGKIVVHKRESRIIRFASEKLPTDPGTTGEGGQSSEINNSQYPEFKKWLPEFLISKDITKREPSMVLFDPNDGAQFGDIKYKGNHVVIEFSAYHQTTQSQAGVQRMSTWLDEHAPPDFYEEQFGRLLKAEGDFILTLTPAMGINWEYDDVFEKAGLYIRTDAICNFLSDKKKTISNIEKTDSIHDIAVIQAATDDNPTISWNVIEKIYNEMPDPDGTAISTRRYGIFKQATGRIFKDFNYNIHVIDPKKYHLNEEFISSCVLARSYDFHQANPHAILWAAISRQDEIFIYQEWSPSPDKWVTETICNRISEMSGDDKFRLNLIDPLANTINTNSGKRTIQEMNHYFLQLYKKGRGCLTTWQPFNTKGEVGQDEIKRRLQNAVRVERPFNNVVREDGLEKRLPTLWVFNNCREMAKSLKHWRRETWANSRQLATKDRKETPTQKHSHYCTALEGLLKERGFRAKRDIIPIKRQYTYFQGRR